MKRLSVYIVMVFMISFFFVSCYYDNEEALYPTLNTSCDTTNVTFSGTIVPLLANNCLTCHSNATSTFGNNIRLVTYANVAAYGVKMIPAVKQTGAKPMPPNSILKACSVAQIEIWVRKGMPNN